MGRFANLLPRSVKRPLLLLRDRGDSVHCPCCGWGFRRFWPSGVGPVVPNSLCPKCGSLPRHRLVWLFLERNPELLERRTRLLHIAPEPLMQKFFFGRPNVDYLSADLLSPLAMERIDLTDIRKPAGSFDAILCVHVLEHIPDDRKAMSEMRRVLSPGGWAILQSPVVWDRPTTFEDWTITSPAERLRNFGQEDHVRIYGADYLDRLRSSGFGVERRAFARELGASSVARFGLDISDDIVICRVPL